MQVVDERGVLPNGIVEHTVDDGRCRRSRNAHRFLARVRRGLREGRGAERDRKQ
jgi:hypothetical protein